MSKGYYTQCTAFDREGERVFPIRIKREWIETQGKDQHGQPVIARSFGITECETITWQQLACRSRNVPNWNSDRIKAETREQLIAAGVIRPAGDGMPCLYINP